MKQRKGKSIAWYLLRITYTSYYSWKKVRGSRAPHWWPQSILLFLMPFPSCYYEFSEPPRTLVPRNGYHAGRHREINRTAQKNRRKEISFSRGQFFRSIDIRTVLSLFQGHHVVKEKGSLGNRSFLSEKFSTTTTTTTTTKHLWLRDPRNYLLLRRACKYRVQFRDVSLLHLRHCLIYKTIKKSNPTPYLKKIP